MLQLMCADYYTQIPSTASQAFSNREEKLEQYRVNKLSKVRHDSAGLEPRFYRLSIESPMLCALCTTKGAPYNTNGMVLLTIIVHC